MYRTILVPLDGSVFAEHALPLALTLARSLRAALELGRVHSTLALLHGDNAPALTDALDRETREAEQAYLGDVVGRLSAAAHVPVKTALLCGSLGPTAEAIREHADAVGAALVVMTTHGRGPLSRFWFGSVADGLVRQASTPVLLVRPRDGAPVFDPEPALRRVLIPLDGSELAEQILDTATEIGGSTGAEYVLLQVVETLFSLDDGPGTPSRNPLFLQRLKAQIEQQRVEAQAYVERVAQRLRARSLRVETRVTLHDEAATAILDDVREHPVDLIALATHGRGGLRRMLLGSVADKVLRGAVIPVLVRHPSDQ